VFSNLLNNAAKFTRPGGHIELTVKQRGSEAVVCVTDDGIGIAADMQPHLFDVFWQASSGAVRGQGGLGIGLSLVRGLVELHHGTVAVHSPGLGQGSEFTVFMPAVTNAVPGRPAAAELAATASPRRLLVVDDSKDNADSLAALLTTLGHDVHTAYDGETALALAFSMRPDAILLDIGMPQLGGIEVCRRLRREAWGKAMFIAALTGWGQDSDRLRTTEAGFDHHLTKPAGIDALVALLEALPGAR
jgi:CheY-like chemotaxis protein